MMRRIETTGTVRDDGSLFIDTAIPVPPGRHRVVVLIEEALETIPSLDWESFIKATYGSLVDVEIMREPVE